MTCRLKGLRKGYVLMQNEQKDRSGNLILLLIGISGSVFFIYLGYLTAAIIGYMIDNGADLLTGMYMILQKPFDNYFNKITPVAMILGFIVFEGIFFLIVNRKADNNIENSEIADTDIIDISEKSLEQSVFDDSLFENSLQIEETNTINLSDYVSPTADEVGEMRRENTTSTQSQRKMENEESIEQEHVSIEFSDEIVTELLNDYDLSQIKAMLALKRHISSVDVPLLKRMFKPTMSAAEITNYINIFYD